MHCFKTSSLHLSTPAKLEGGNFASVVKWSLGQMELQTVAFFYLNYRRFIFSTLFVFVQCFSFICIYLFIRRFSVVFQLYWALSPFSALCCVWHKLFSRGHDTRFGIL